MYCLAFYSWSNLEWFHLEVSLAPKRAERTRHTVETSKEREEILLEKEILHRTEDVTYQSEVTLLKEAKVKTEEKIPKKIAEVKPQEMLEKARDEGTLVRLWEFLIYIGWLYRFI